MKSFLISFENNSDNVFITNELLNKTTSKNTISGYFMREL